MISETPKMANYGNGFQQYNVDSDSDSEDEAAAVVPAKTLSTGYTSQLEEMNKLKQQSSALLDGKWRENRNKQLLCKMLELEEPTITAKMVEFLLQDGVCEVLLKFVTHVENPESMTNVSSSTSDIYKMSYKTTMLIAPDEPSEALAAFLGKRASNIARTLFDVFREGFKGTFYHPHRIFETLIRFYPGDVFDGITSDGRVEQRMSSLLRFIGCPPVSDILVMLVALTPVPRNSALYASCSRHRWTFAEGLANWILIQRIVEVFVKAKNICYCTDSVTASDHISAAAQALQDVIDRLSVEDLGELLLQPVGHIPSIVDMLIETFKSNSLPISLRSVSVRLLCFLLKKSAEESFTVVVAPHSGATGGPITIMNRLNPQRYKLIKFLKNHLQNILLSLVDSGDESIPGNSDGSVHVGDESVTAKELNTNTADMSIGKPEDETKDEQTESEKKLKIISAPSTLVRHPGHVVAVPFTSLRMYLVELLVLLIESEEGESVSNDLSESIWRLLMAWILEYPHTNIYHAMFQRILFTVVRKSYDNCLKTLLQKAKFITFLVENFQLPIGVTSRNNDSFTSCSSQDADTSNLSDVAALDSSSDSMMKEVSEARSPASSISLPDGNENEVEVELSAAVASLSLSSTDTTNSGIETTGVANITSTSTSTPSASGKVQEVSEQLRHARDMIRGLLANCCHILRLQSDSQPPSAYLRGYLTTHKKWPLLISDVRLSTEIWHLMGMGITCPGSERDKERTPMLTALTLVSAADEGDGIDHGSRFAKSLGFDGELPWPTQPGEAKKKSKNKKKKKKSSSKRKSRGAEEKGDSGEGAGADKGDQELDVEGDDDEDDDVAESSGGAGAGGGGGGAKVVSEDVGGVGGSS